MRSRSVVALVAVALMLAACAQLGHAFGLFGVRVTLSQATVAYTHSGESAIFDLNTLAVDDWERYCRD